MSEGPPTEPVSVNISGWLKKKGKIFGLWSDYFVELHQTDLYIRKDDKTTEIKHHYVITNDTKIIMNTDGKFPFITLKIPDVRIINFSANDYNTLANWLMAFRSAAFENSRLSMNSFDVIAVIGRGFFGKVMLVQKKGEPEYYALKTVKKEKLVKSHQIQTILSERNILAKSKHPFIVNLQFAFQTASKFYIGMEYVPGGDLIGLMQRQERIPDNDCRIYAAELAHAIEHLHSIGVVFRDLKPDNILICQDGHIKLTDFGLAKDISELGTTRTFCGTTEFMAPEIVFNKPYNYMVDWWSFGILVYDLLYRRTPFYAEKRDSILSKIKYAEPRFPDDANPDDVDFISKFLVKNPNLRATYKDVEGHPFWHGMTRGDIIQKKFTPSFVPIVREHISTEYFDEEFTKEKPIDSVATPMLGDDNVFNGFSYIDDQPEIDDT